VRSTRVWLSGALALFVVVADSLSPERASAGGSEFPGGGTRSLGRGGAAMARADDPSVMLTNPALLADLWGDQALLGASLLLVDACFQPYGGYGVGVQKGDVIKLGDEILVQRFPAGSTLPDGTPLTNYEREPYPLVCYEGPAPFLPHLALTMKLSDELGIGLGFFPPDNASLNQFGNRDGTVDTDLGLRPNPLRSIRTHLNASYFSVLGAVGYRPTDWLRVGLGLQWQAVAFQARQSLPAVVAGRLGPQNEIRVDIFGRDLFIPGVIGSIHLKPFDALDIALGAKWSDRIISKAKLDITTGAFGLTEPLEYIDGNTGMTATLPVLVPTFSSNQQAVVSAPPIWVPQVSAGLRYADRLKPLQRGEVTEDSMESERWDVELDLIYYFTSALDRTQADMENASATFRTRNVDGTLDRPIPALVGDCIGPADQLQGRELCERRSRTEINGSDQAAARLGADYNVLPGLFTLRAGLSYETDGQAPSWRSPFLYLAGRTGLHAGFTVRIASKTDVSFGFAHFIQKEVRLQVNPESAFEYRAFLDDPERYHLAPGEELDGPAGIEVPNTGRAAPGPYYANVGSSYYDLSVLSASVSQHF
jgi:hypothetical protein